MDFSQPVQPTAYTKLPVQVEFKGAYNHRKYIKQVQSHYMDLTTQAILLAKIEEELYTVLVVLLPAGYNYT